MGHWGHVFDAGDLDAGVLDGPDCGLTTRTRALDQHVRTPCSMAPRAAFSAAICAAYGVDLREPLKPTLPADAHERTLPDWSVMDTMVLLNELLMCATP